VGMRLKSRLLKKLSRDADIPLTREHDYTQLYFVKGSPVLQGAHFPLALKTFKMEENINAPEPWKDVLSAYGLDSRNLSYPKKAH